MKLDNSFMRVYVEAFGKLFRVLALARSVDEANAVCAENKEAAVIARDEESGVILVAEKERTKLK